MSIINKKAGIRGYTIDGGSSYPIDSRGRVKRCIFGIKYQYHVNDVVCNVSTGADDWGAQMGDGSIIPLSNPVILYQTRTNSFVQFDMRDPYPSNSPCVLVYRSDSACIQIDITDNPQPFIVNAASGNFAVTIDTGNSDNRGRVNTLQAIIEYPNQACDVSFEISTDPSHWGARMGDGTVINLRNPKVMAVNAENAVVQFTMDTAYPSNSPCVLVYRSADAYYTAIPKNSSGEFIPVESINRIPTSMIAGSTISLSTAEIEPITATELQINWAVESGPGVVTGDKLTASGNGTIILKATIVGGGNNHSDFVKRFTITSTVNTISVSIQPYDKCNTGDTLMVSASATNGILVYQWYVSDTKSTNGTAIAGETSDKLNVPDASGTKYYYCKLSSPGTADVYTTICTAEVVIVLKSISITPATTTFTVDGKTYKHSVVFNPANYPGTIRWSTSNVDVASIGTDGSVTPIADGTTVITATEIMTDISASKTITVKAWIPVTKISGIPSNIDTGTPVTISATVSPSNANSKNIVWSIVYDGNTGATVNNNVLIATGSGQLTLRATIKNGISASVDYVQNFSISVKDKFVFVPVTDISLGLDLNLIHGVGEILNLSPTVIPSNASFKNVRFSCISGNVEISGSSIIINTDGNVVIRATVDNGSGSLDDMRAFTNDFTIKAETKIPFIPVTDACIEFKNDSGANTGEYLKTLTNTDVQLPLVIYPYSATHNVPDDISAVVTGMEFGEYTGTNAVIGAVETWDAYDGEGVQYDEKTGMIHISNGNMNHNTLYKINITVRVKNGTAEGTDYVKQTYFCVVGLYGDMFSSLTDIEPELPSRLRCYYPILADSVQWIPGSATAMNKDTYTFDGTSITLYYKDEDHMVNAYVFHPLTDMVTHTVDPMPIFTWGLLKTYVYPQNPGILAYRIRVPNSKIDDEKTTDIYNPVLTDFVKDFEFVVEDPFIRIEDMELHPCMEVITKGVPMVLQPKISTGKGLDCYNPYWDEDEATYQDVKWSMVSGVGKITPDGVLTTTVTGTIVVEAYVDSGFDEEFIWSTDADIYTENMSQVSNYKASDKDEYGRAFNPETGKYENPIMIEHPTLEDVYLRKNVSIPYVKKFWITVTDEKNEINNLIRLTLSTGNEISISMLSDFANLCNDKPADTLIKLSDGRSFVKNQVTKVTFAEFAPNIDGSELVEDIILDNVEYSPINNGSNVTNRLSVQATHNDGTLIPNEDVYIRNVINSTLTSNPETPEFKFDDGVIEWNYSVYKDDFTGYLNSISGHMGLELCVDYPIDDDGNTRTATKIISLTRGRTPYVSWENVFLGINMKNIDDDYKVICRDDDGHYKSFEIPISYVAEPFGLTDEDMKDQMSAALESVSVVVTQGDYVTAQMNARNDSVIIECDDLAGDQTVYVDISIPKYIPPVYTNCPVYAKKSDDQIEFEVLYQGVRPIVSTTSAEFRDKSAFVFKLNTFDHIASDDSMSFYLPWSIHFNTSNLKAVMSTSPNVDGPSSTRITVPIRKFTDFLIAVDDIDKDVLTWANAIKYPYLIIVFDKWVDSIKMGQSCPWYMSSDAEMITRRIELRIFDTPKDVPSYLTLENFGRNFTSLTSVENILPVTGDSCMEGFLRGCSMFNQPLKVPSTVTGDKCMKDFLRDCTSFNSAITLPENVSGQGCMKGFLRGCVNYNKPIDIPGTVTGRECLRSFMQGCKSFNQSIDLPSNLSGWACLFEFMSECISFDQDIILPENVTDRSDPGREMCNFMRGCDNMTSKITVPRGTGTNAQVSEQTLSSRHLQSRLSQTGVTITGLGTYEFLRKVSNTYDIEMWPYTHFRNLD